MAVSSKADLSQENVEALKKGLPNLEKHIENMKKFGVPVVVAINRFGTDTDAEIAVLSEAMEKNGVAFSLCEALCQGRRRRHGPGREGRGCL